MSLMKNMISAKRYSKEEKETVLMLEHFAKYFSALDSSIADSD